MFKEAILIRKSYVSAAPEAALPNLTGVWVLKGNVGASTDATTIEALTCMKEFSSKIAVLDLLDVEKAIADCVASFATGKCEGFTQPLLLTADELWVGLPPAVGQLAHSVKALNGLCHASDSIATGQPCGLLQGPVFCGSVQVRSK